MPDALLITIYDGSELNGGTYVHSQHVTLYGLSLCANVQGLCVRLEQKNGGGCRAQTNFNACFTPVERGRKL